MAHNNEAAALVGNMAGFCGYKGFDCLPMFPSGLSLAGGFGVFERYYFPEASRNGRFGLFKTYYFQGISFYLQRNLVFFHQKIDIGEFSFAALQNRLVGYYIQRFDAGQVFFAERHIVAEVVGRDN